MKARGSRRLGGDAKASRSRRPGVGAKAARAVRLGGGRRVRSQAPGFAGSPLVGRDLAARPQLRAARRQWAPTVLAVVVAGLLLACLRVEILRIRYDLAEAARQERLLREDRNAALLEARRLRDPRRLLALAEERGFVRPDRVMTLERRGWQPARIEEPDVAPAARSDPGAAPATVATRRGGEVRR